MQVDHDPVAVARGSPSAGGVVARRRVRTARILLEPLRERGRSRTRAPRPASRRRERARRSSSSIRRATAAAASSGWAATPAGSAMAQPHDRASSRSRALPPGAGTKIAASARTARRVSGLSTTGCGTRAHGDAGSSDVASAAPYGRGRPPSPAPLLSSARTDLRSRSGRAPARPRSGALLAGANAVVSTPSGMRS